MRYGDLTVGDSWMVNFGNFRENRFIDNVKGTTLLQICTPKGQKMFSWIKGLLNVKMISLKEAYVQPALLPTNRTVPPTREMIYHVDKSEYGAFIENLFSVSFEQQYILYMKLYHKQRLVKIIKRVIKRIIP